MYRPLSPCPSCQRHVLASAESCPFCGDDTREVQARKLPASAHQQMRRSTLVMLGATLALGATGLGGAGLVGCGGSRQQADPPGPPDDDGGTMAKYGGPPAPSNPPDDDGAPMAKYGAPAPPDDNGGEVEAYGAPAPLDTEAKPKKP